MPTAEPISSFCVSQLFCWSVSCSHESVLRRTVTLPLTFCTNLWNCGFLPCLPRGISLSLSSTCLASIYMVDAYFACFTTDEFRNPSLLTLPSRNCAGVWVQVLLTSTTADDGCTLVKCNCTRKENTVRQSVSAYRTHKPQFHRKLLVCKC